jgi:hypothetical protein
MIGLDKQKEIQELINEAMQSDLPKSLCIALSIVRSEIDGYLYGGCLCSLNERYQFIKNYIEWFEKNKK